MRFRHNDVPERSGGSAESAPSEAAADGQVDMAAYELAWQNEADAFAMQVNVERHRTSDFPKWNLGPLDQLDSLGTVR